MNLYLISQESNTDYDTYSDAVVAAGGEDDARTIHPDGDKLVPTGGELQDEQCGTWTCQDNVRVRLVGIADAQIPRGVVCASFHAG